MRGPSLISTVQTEPSAPTQVRTKARASMRACSAARSGPSWLSPGAGGLLSGSADRVLINYCDEGWKLGSHTLSLIILDLHDVSSWLRLRRGIRKVGGGRIHTIDGHDGDGVVKWRRQLGSLMFDGRNRRLFARVEGMKERKFLQSRFVDINNDTYSADKA